MKLSFGKRETLEFRELEPGDVFSASHNRSVFYVKLSNEKCVEIGPWVVHEDISSDDNVVKVRAEMTIFR